MTGLREGQIRPDDLMAEQQRRYAADVAWLMARRDRFVEVDCPACGAHEPVPEWRKYELDYVRCGGCGTVYVSPRPDPSLLAEYYRSSENYEYWNEVIFPASEGARRERVFKPRAKRVAEITRRHGSARGALVDVGAGFGTFCEEIHRLGEFERVVAVEPEPHLAETCRRKGIEVIEAPLESADLDGVAADVVTAFEVVEHLFSPREFLALCARLLRVGGLLIVTCPNVEGFDIKVLREKSSAVDAEHLNYMHPASLGAMFRDAGFEILESSTPGELDAELVRKQVLSGDFTLEGQPFLEQVLIDGWDDLGDAFQQFLKSAGLSSHMWLVGRLRDP